MASSDSVAGPRAANDPSRRGPVEFSQTYLRNPQSLVVPTGSTIQSLADLELAEVNSYIEATRNDGFLQRAIDRANVGVELEPAPTGR